ncbi:MAG: 50S ribosomal protein L31 [Candidatus Margulisiibacteriota bacterium]|jgi:large subunit ribosomal protein L31
MSEQTKTKSPKKATTAKTKDTAKNTKKVLYSKVIATCACGAEYETGSTLETIRVDICSNCHPFFTGEKRLLDSEGRVEKFLKKYQKTAK